MKNVTAIYVRVSSLAQEFAAQEVDLKKWADGREGVVWYHDKATGTNLARPGLQKLLEDVRAGRVGTVVVWRLDRLGRTASGLHQLFDELVALKVNFISLRDGVNLETPTGRLVAGVLASVAVFETEVRSERIHAGIAAKRERGEKWNNGRPKGSRNKTTEAVREQIWKMKEDNKPITEIAEVLQLARQTVYTVLAEGKKVSN